MEEQENVTYRVGSVDDPTNVGKSARTPELAKFAARNLIRIDCLVLEKTLWEEKFDKLRPAFTVIMDAEHEPGEWKLGVLEKSA